MVCNSETLWSFFLQRVSNDLLVVQVLSYTLIDIYSFIGGNGMVLLANVALLYW